MITTLIFFFLGLIVGSFLNVVVYRIDLAESIFIDRSKCPQCKKIIRWYDNIPLLSFIILKARCRDCNKKISWQYPILELVTGIVFACTSRYFFSIIYSSTWIDTLFYLVVFSILLVILAYDIKKMEIPMAILWFGIFMSICYLLYFDGTSFTSGMTIFNSELFSGTLGALVAFLFFFGMVVVSKETWMGMGDAYLAILVGLLAGWPLVLFALMLAFLIGSVVGIFLIAFQKRTTLKSQVPFAPFLAIGTFLAIIIAEAYPQINHYLINPFF